MESMGRFWRASPSSSSTTPASVIGPGSARSRCSRTEDGMGENSSSMLSAPTVASMARMSSSVCGVKSNLSPLAGGSRLATYSTSPPKGGFGGSNPSSPRPERDGVAEREDLANRSGQPVAVAGRAARNARHGLVAVARRAEEGGGAEVEEAPVRRHEPVAVPERGRGHADYR